MKAIGNNIIIIPEKVVGDKTKGGLLLVKKDREDIRYTKATVATVSEDIKAVSVGDQIYYDRHAGHSIQVKEGLYKVIQVGDVVLVE